MRPLFMSAALALSLIAAPALAQGNHDAKAPAGKAAHAKGAKREARMVERLKKEGLSEAKAKRVVTTLGKYKGELRSIKQEAKANRAALKRDPNDAKAKQGLADARTKVKAVRERQKAEIAKFLTPAEQAKVEKSIRRAHKGGKGKHHKANKEQSS